MVRGKSTDPKVREIVIHQYHKEKAMGGISSELTIATTTVFNIIKKYGETASINVRGKSTGRPKTVSQISVKHLIRIYAVKNIGKSWSEVTQSNLHGVWRKVCPHFFNASDTMASYVEESSSSKVTTELVAMVNQLELQVNQDDIDELLTSHNEDITVEELILCKSMQKNDPIQQNRHHCHLVGCRKRFNI
ncbi:hypothetical protein QE152_g26392 [Popillia japonica]|uniref:Transposase n=1 Tax=Popillia japonica TaxID=7064 RepID=A0AAW1JWW8_POPJA